MAGTAGRQRIQRVIAVVGPTGVGKSALAESLAERIGGEVVSADSMQVYRGMDIGTAKVPPAERRVPYHCIDLADPGTPFSAAMYQQYARRAIDDIVARGRVPVLCGGTGLYVRAALDDMRFPSGEIASPVREEIEALAERLGAEGLHAHLARIDPASAALIHPNNVRRTVRALEMAAHGVSYAEQASRFSVRTSVYPTVLIGLVMRRDLLYAAIDARVDAMLEAGLLDEVRALLVRGYREALTARQAIGYKELVPVIEKGAPLDQAVAAIRQATRRYAKRQLTWFRADPRIRWIDVTGRSPEDVRADALRLVESADTHDTDAEEERCGSNS
ncbi:tRNA (adenosine(37)-N6)-dimethylallyltransferase MiaA [Coriobacteriia bacterium Es71-Z0120]|uniref:tRNA (adenosine(37)-N6)-dimethylallyltransferase MiaA n=1 Tax=Parvivirga hydrogeniphila TaxID=2939460 RepID=UPI002260EE71|nr:tRNA (adenosine(37)-N6)-dimethylallyltransferase MiaA [Parvivirga hydrogeniphila]MCL4079628.1 tRNA (adenosine(37)-N6)-dimethylallyltransferase MiaA [Parvivirga hydrogeniphila]